MGISIRDPEAGRLARELAALRKTNHDRGDRPSTTQPN